MKKIFILILPALMLAACKSNEKADAYGNFEATEITVSAEASGKLLSFTLEEGQTVEKGQLLGFIDTIQLELKKQQLEATRRSIAARSKNVFAQIEVYKDQKRNAERELDRLKKMAKDGAATPKQIDDMQGNIDVYNSQIASVQSQNAPVFSDMKSVDAQIAQIEDQINKCKIYAPASGIVLSKLMEEQELVTPGKALFKMADLNELFLRAYVSGDQLSSIKIGQKVNVFIDAKDDKMKKVAGTITWVSSKAEFTPKIIQTKEERVNLVYAIKVKAVNDGSLKIGMPGEVRFEEK